MPEKRTIADATIRVTNYMKYVEMDYLYWESMLSRLRNEKNQCISFNFDFELQFNRVYSVLIANINRN